MEVQISVENTGEVDRSIKMEIPRALYEKQFNRMLSQTTSQVHLRGFRPGRAPKAMVAKLYGDCIKSDVLGDLINDAFGNAVKEHDLKVVGEPNLEIEDEDKEKDVSVTAKVSVYPEPTIEKYLDLSFEVEIEEEPEGELEKRIESLQEHLSTLEPKEGAIEKGDVVVIDYKATIDGESFEHSDGEGVKVDIGGKAAFKEIEEALIGAKINDEREAELVLPDEAGERGGETAQYKIIVKEVSKKIVPEVDDEFAKKTGLAEDLAELKKNIAQKITTEVKMRNDENRRNKLFEAIIAENPFEVPQVMVDQEIRQTMAQMMGMDGRDPKARELDVATYREYFSADAERKIRSGVALMRILEREETTADEDEVENWLDKRAEESGRTREEINKAYSYPSNSAHIKEVVVQEKLIDKILESAKIKEVPKKDAEEEQGEDAAESSGEAEKKEE